MVKKSELYESCVQLLKDKGFDESCGTEVTWIFQDILGDNELQLHTGEDLTPQQETAIRETVEKRSEGYPLQYLLGEWEFYGLPFKVGEGVLIPRQDTETLVDLISKKYKNSSPITLIDLCSGSGCIGISVEKNVECEQAFSVEKSPEAESYLRENIRLNGSIAQVIIGDVLEKETADSLPTADVIVCNPPYLSAEDMRNLQTEVTYEPESALYGGEDGLDFYRSITRLWKNRLKKGGMLVYEIGMGQEDDVMEMMVHHGFSNVRSVKDLCGIYRCVYGIYNKES
jgi:release factor glutamine methyltransferase